MIFAEDFGIDPELMRKLGSEDYLKKVEKLAAERENSFVFYVAHEVATHVAMKRSPEKMMAFVDAMYDYTQKGKTFGGNSAQWKQAFYAKHGKTLDFDSAVEEVVADAILDLYRDEASFMAAMERIINGTDEQARFAADNLDRVISTLHAIQSEMTEGAFDAGEADYVKTALPSYNSRTDAERSIAQMEQEYDSLSKRFLEANRHGDTELAKELSARMTELNRAISEKEAVSAKKENAADDGDIRYSRQLRKGDLFPTKTEANTAALSWAHSDGVKAADQKLVYYRGLWYVVEAVDSNEDGYEIVKQLSEKEYEEYLEDKNNGVAKGQSVQKSTGRLGRLDSKRNQNGRRRQRFDSISAGQRGKNLSIQRMDQKQIGRRNSERGSDRNNEGSGTNQQEVQPFGNLDIKLSSQLDADYLAAVKRGDMATAQKMVDEAAEAAMVHSKIRDEDGKLIKVYHGTDSDFTVFDRTKGRSSMDIQGMFFSPWDIDAAGYGSNVRAFYLDIRNPAPEQTAYRVLRRHQQENYAGAKAREDLERMRYDGVNNENEEYIAFYPAQIKSAAPVTRDDNGNIIPLSERFNPDKTDIRRSTKPDPDAIKKLIDKYGEIDPGEEPRARDAHIPKKTSEKKKVSEAVRTIYEAEATPDSMLKTIADLVADGEFSFDVYTDEKALKDAIKTVTRRGWNNALSEWLADVKNGTVSKKNAALGWALYNNAANSGDTKTAITIMNAMVQHRLCDFYKNILRTTFSRSFPANGLFFFAVSCMIIGNSIGR